MIEIYHITILIITCVLALFHKEEEANHFLADRK